MDSYCPGPRHEEKGAGWYCPKRPGSYPDDDGWDAYCDACREGYDAHVDQQIDAREDA